MKIGYIEKHDHDFIRWTSNLLRKFLDDGTVNIVRNNKRADLLVASVWRKHHFPLGMPVLLISNESWDLFPPHAPLSKYFAVLGICPPTETCNFIQYPYSAAHFDLSIENLQQLRRQLLNVRKTKFCCFVVSNTYGNLGIERVRLFEKINQWKSVDSAGSISNNLNYRAPRGLDFLFWISEYKYMICLENSKCPNYITEKPFQAWYAGTVPIYDGGCADELNQKAIINAGKENVLEALAQLEMFPQLYEEKRQASLTNSPLSLSLFETQFRTSILERFLSRPSTGMDKCLRSVGNLLRI